MYEILSRRDLAEGIHQFDIAAASVARKAQAGQFVIIMVDGHGERIPLTIAGWDRDAGSVRLVVSAVGKTTRKLAALQAGDAIQSFSGPLGLPAETSKYGTVVTVTAGYSVLTARPVVTALREAGNRIISIIRAPSEDSLFGQEEMAELSDRLIVVTGDGSHGECGFITEPLEEVLAAEAVDRVFTVGPVCVMKLVAATTQARPRARALGVATGASAVPTVASLNPIMVDGTGMCGCCRVTVGGETKFACVDGPEFDAHQVDWNSLLARRCTYGSTEGGWARYRCLDCAQW